MLKNYLNVALRSLARHKGYTFINMMGLSVGMACGILILLWVTDQLSYNLFHDGYRSIYRVNTRDNREERPKYYDVGPYALADILKRDYPQVESVTRFYPSHFMVDSGEISSNEPNGAFVDPAFFSVFSFPLLRGSYLSKGMGEHCVVLSAGMAERYFGEDDPLGKTLSLDKKMDFRVVGVIRVPAQSSLRGDLFVPLDTLAAFDPFLVKKENIWKHFLFQIFVKLRQNADVLSLRQAIHGILKPLVGRFWHLEPQRLDRIHLYSMDGVGGRILYVYSFSLVAFFVLLIACMNYVNLATARFESRAREAWIRKSLGARKWQLAAQYMGETVVLTVIASTMSLVLVELALPFFNDLMGTQVNLAFDDASLVLQFLTLVVLTALAAGSYPALRINDLEKGGGSALRKGLVLFQFAMSTVFFICSITVFQQLDFMQAKKVRLKTGNILYGLMKGDSKDCFEIAREKLMGIPGVLNVTACRSLPSMRLSATPSVDWDEKYDTLYRGEEVLATYFLYFSFLSIFISCLGLFGLASFLVEHRTKEIGIRKALGSSTAEIFVLLTVQLSRWVLWGILAAFPVGYLVMERWLDNFAYRIDVRVETFLIAGGASFLIAVLSTSFQALRTARSLPVDALRYE